MLKHLHLDDNHDGTLSVVFGETPICTVNEKTGKPLRIMWPLLFPVIKKDMNLLLLKRKKKESEEKSVIPVHCGREMRVSEDPNDEHRFHLICPECLAWAIRYVFNPKERRMLREKEEGCHARRA